MLKVNEYFDGAVKSIALENKDGDATIGVMEAGEYEFGTSSVEFVTIVNGTMNVKLPGTDDWQTYSKGDTFIVEKGVKFNVKMEEPVAYYCLYK